MSEKPFCEARPNDDGSFDELVIRFTDAMVHVEMLSDNGVYIGFYADDGKAHQLWIGSKKKLHCHHDDASGPPPRFTAHGLDRRPPHA